MPPSTNANRRAAYKRDIALEDKTPWPSPARRHAGAVHPGGTGGSVAAQPDAAINVMPTRPLVLLGQQYLPAAPRTEFCNRDIS